MSALARQSVRMFVSRLASRRPTPGGGSAAALTSALGAALLVKVGRIILARRPEGRGGASTGPSRRPTVGRSLTTAQRRAIGRLCTACDAHARALVQLVDADAEAYGQLFMVWGSRNRRAVQRAQRRALEVPLAMCERTVAVLRQAPALTKVAGRSLGSDVEAGVALLTAGFTAAAATVVINLEGLGAPQAALVRQRLRQLWLR